MLEPLGEDTKNHIMLAVNESWRWPPMTRETITGEGDDFAKFLSRWPSIVNENSGILDFDKVDKMMATGQIAYPMMLKKAPIISIVRSASGFSVKSADEEFAKIANANLQEVLPKKIEEILTYLEYGAYFGEVTYEPIYPQIYGLPKSDIPYWVISDFNGVHPNTITKILRDEDTKAFQGFIQQPAGFHEPVEVGTERALIIPNGGMFGNLHGSSVLEPVYVWWFWYELVWRAFLRFLQRAGVGVVVVKAPSRGRVEIGGKSIDNLQWALQMASSLHRTNYAAVPSDMDSDHGNPLWVIDYLKMGQNEGAQFVQALELLSNNIKNYLLTGDSGGATEGAEFEVMLDTERILSHVGMYISEYVLPKMLYWNNSDTNKATLEFQGANSRVLPLLFKLMAVAGNTAGNALQNVDWRLLFNKGGVPVLSEEEVEQLKEEKKKEQEEMMQKKQAASAKPEFGRPNNPDEKAKQPPGGEGRWTAKRDEEGQAERLGMVKEALRVPLIALTAGQVAELEYIGLRLPDDRPIAIYDLDRHEDTVNELKLYNPYHSEKGEFTTKWKAKTIVNNPEFKNWKSQYEERLNTDYDFRQKEEQAWGEMPSTGAGWKGMKKEPRSFAKEHAKQWSKFVSKWGNERALWQVEMDMRERKDDWHKEYYDELLVEISKLKGPSKKLEGEYRLFNPYHDERGWFTSKERATGTPSFAGGEQSDFEKEFGYTGKEEAIVSAGKALGYAAVGMWATGVVSKIIGGPIRKIKGKKPSDKIFSIKIKDKEYSMTYEEIEHKGTRVGKFGKWAYLGANALKFVGVGMVISRVFPEQWEKQHPGEEWPGWREASERWNRENPDYEPSWKARWGGFSGTYDEEYVRKSREWQDKYGSEYRDQFRGAWSYGSKKGVAGWPRGATEDQFKKMYRDLARRWHPDKVSGTSKATQEEFTKIMQEINRAYADKDWQRITELHKKLEDILGQNNLGEFLIANLVLLRVMMEAMNDDLDFLAFESDEPIDPFPYEDGMIFIDVETAKKVLHMAKILAEMPMPFKADKDAELEDFVGDDELRTSLSRW